jgi:endo-1,4-beta-xylanase
LNFCVIKTPTASKGVLRTWPEDVKANGMKIILALLLVFLFSFSIKEEPLCEEVKLFEKASFPVGVALDADKLMKEKRYWKTAVEQFNSFTPEMILKPIYIHPKKEVYNFNEIDQLMNYCKKYNIRIHGHTLVWHKALPAWIENFKGTPKEWESLLKDHIQTVVKHCKWYIRSWDVVNEAFNDDGTLRKNIWLKNIGESYIEKAFLYANEADPSALLFYNDYSLERPIPKLRAVLKFFNNLRANGVKIDGIGMQMHVGLETPTIDEINNVALKIQEANFSVHYSELDVSLNTDPSLLASTKRLLEIQKKRMKDIVKGYMKLDPKNRFGITLWGVSDNDSWLSEEQTRPKPVLYDTRYKIKPAYCGFLEGLTE